MTQIATLPPCVNADRRSLTFRFGQPGTGLFAVSWFVVSVLGLVPLAEARLHRVPNLSPLAILVFFTAVGSAAALRRRYTWLGIVLHIYSQIAIWLSVTFCSMAFVMSIMVG